MGRGCQPTSVPALEEALFGAVVGRLPLPGPSIGVSRLPTAVSHALTPHDSLIRHLEPGSAMIGVGLKRGSE